MAIEYTTAVMTHGFMGVYKGEINRQELEAQLTSKGSEGWELLHVWFDQKLHKEKDGHLLIFKREVPSGAPMRTGDQFEASAPSV
jgi:hypothetical protein